MGPAGRLAGAIVSRLRHVMSRDVTTVTMNHKFSASWRNSNLFGELGGQGSAGGRKATWRANGELDGVGEFLARVHILVSY
jgi:hypothetical protein